MKRARALSRVGFAATVSTECVGTTFFETHAPADRRWLNLTRHEYPRGGESRGFARNPRCAHDRHYVATFILCRSPQRGDVALSRTPPNFPCRHGAGELRSMQGTAEGFLARLARPALSDQMGSFCNILSVHSSPRLLGSLDLVIRAISIRQRIASDREGLSCCCLAQLSMSVFLAQAEGSYRQDWTFASSGAGPH